MGLILGTHDHAISKVEGGRSDGKVIGRNEATLPGKRGEQVGPAVGDLRTEGNDRHSRQERVNLGPTTRRAGGCIGQSDTDQQLCVHDGRERNGLPADGGDGLIPGSG